MVELIVFVIIGLAFYGGFSLFRDLRGKVTPARVQQGITTACLALLGAMVMLPGGRLLAQTETPVNLEIDVNPLFESINQYLPIMFGIFAVAGGISIAMVIVRFLINAIIGAFKGGGI